MFESEVSVMTMSNGMMDINEISPSDFNVLNQRYDDDNDKIVQERSNVLFFILYYRLKLEKNNLPRDPVSPEIRRCLIIRHIHYLAKI